MPTRSAVTPASSTRGLSHDRHAAHGGVLPTTHGRVYDGPAAPGDGRALREERRPMTEPNEPSRTPTADGAPSSPPPPDRPPSTEWREPPWFPPRDGDRRERRANMGAIVIGLIILAVGIYYLLDRTLGIAMPRIQWGRIWPIFLIVLGGLILIRSIQRR
jgi:hypothetical protein